MTWCHHETSHYLSQCWQSMYPYGVTKPQWDLTDLTQQASLQFHWHAMINIWCWGQNISGRSGLIPWLLMSGSLQDQVISIYGAFDYIGHRSSVLTKIVTHSPRTSPNLINIFSIGPGDGLVPLPQEILNKFHEPYRITRLQWVKKNSWYWLSWNIPFVIFVYSTHTTYYWHRIHIKQRPFSPLVHLHYSTQALWHTSQGEGLIQWSQI